MTTKKKPSGIMEEVSNYLSSLRLTISLLLILAIVSIFGTIIPQNATPQEYLQIYKLATYKILKILGFLDMYHAPWFFFLLILLSLNLIFCSWKRFQNTWRSLTASIPKEEESWKLLSPRRLLFKEKNGQQVLAVVKEIFAKFYPPPRVQVNSQTFLITAEKGKISRLGVYLVHLSILIVLLGALIGFYAGFRGQVSLKEGEKTNKIFLRHGQEILLPGFTIQLEKFSVSFYPTGAPKEFKSIISIFENGQKKITKPILVNQPLTYKGITFYQASYGVAGVESVTLEVKDQKSGQVFTVPVFWGKESLISEKSISLCLNRFLPDFQGWGPAFQISISELAGPPENHWVFINHPDFSTQRREQRFQIHLKEWHPFYYSGLQVTKDPGVEIVWLGCGLMIFGFYLTFFLTHRRIWARLIPTHNGFLLEILPYWSRDRQESEKEFQQIEQALLSKLSFLTKR